MKEKMSLPKDLKDDQETLGVLQELALWPGLGTPLSSLREKPLHQRPFYDSLIP